jgi:hypothetical protein
VLELASNTIKALGIFGRLSPDLEAYFDGIEKKYSHNPQAGYDIFRHLTLTYMPGASVPDIALQLDLLRDLKKFLPYKLMVKRLFAKEEATMPSAEHIAIEFGLKQTKELVDFIKIRVGEKNVVETPYIKTIWFVPKENQHAAMQELAGLTEIVFTDFCLVSNKQNDENTIYTTNRFYQKIQSQ